MDIVALKDLVFRHFEKGLLALAILFVAYNAYSSFTGTEEPGPVQGIPPGGPRAGRPPAKPDETLGAIEDSYRQATAPFLRVPGILPADHNWFYPPRTMWLPHVQLQMEKTPAAGVSIGRKIGRGPVPVVVSPEELVARGYPKSGMTAPCRVTVKLDEKANDTIVFTAGDLGDYVVYEVHAENWDRFRIPVYVLGEGVVPPRPDLPTPEIKEVKEDPAALGTVVLRFSVPLGGTEAVVDGRKIQYLEPSYYLIFRRSEHEKEERAIARIEGRGAAPPAEGRPEPGTGPRRPAGLPGLPGGPAPGPRPGPRPEAAQAPTDFVFRDKDVEAETKYTYRVRSALVPKQPGGKLDTKNSAPVGITTDPKFSFAFIGLAGGAGKFIIFIGPRERPIEHRIVTVPIGGLVGDRPREGRAAGAAPAEAKPPAEEGAEAPPEGPAKPEKPKPDEDEGAGSRFVTRYVLVDIETRLCRPVEAVERRYMGINPLGQAVFQQIPYFREMSFEHMAILRDRKNRLITLWREQAPTAKGGAAEGGRHEEPPRSKGPAPGEGGRP